MKIPRSISKCFPANDLSSRIYPHRDTSTLRGMTATLMHWLLAHLSLITEVLGVLFALIYLWFSIRQNIWLWPFGLFTSFFYILVFFRSRLYADMGLQVYYLLISLYGWYHWLYGGGGEQKNVLPVVRIGKTQGLRLFLITFLIYWILVGLLTYLPGWIDIPSSQMIYWDAFTTAGSIVATWMLARKILEHWLIWIVVDLVSLGMYIYKGLYLTSFLFLVYTIMAVTGFVSWKKDLQKGGIGKDYLS